MGGKKKRADFREREIDRVCARKLYNITARGTCEISRFHFPDTHGRPSDRRDESAAGVHDDVCCEMRSLRGL